MFFTVLPSKLPSFLRSFHLAILVSFRPSFLEAFLPPLVSLLLVLLSILKTSTLSMLLIGDCCHQCHHAAAGGLRPTFRPQKMWRRCRLMHRHPGVGVQGLLGNSNWEEYRNGLKLGIEVILDYPELRDWEFRFGD